MSKSLVVSVICLAACSSGPSADDACTQDATASCAKLDSCIVGGVVKRYGDLPTCQARIKAACVTSLGAPATGNTPALVETCAAAIPGASCADYEDGNVAACQAKVGTLAIGVACTYPGQCASSVCAIAKGTNCGVCAAASSAGDSCATASCSRGFVCVADSSQCQPDGAAAAACDKDHPCGFGLSCVGSTLVAMGSCQSSGKAVGDACDTKRVDSAACDGNQNLVCVASTKMCATLALATDGMPCGFVNMAEVGCTNTATCFGAAGSTPGTCKAAAKDGAACDTVNGPGCLSPARCVTGSATATTGICATPDASCK